MIRALINLLINNPIPEWADLPDGWEPNPATVGHIAREADALRANGERNAAVLGGGK